MQKLEKKVFKNRYHGYKDSKNNGSEYAQRIWRFGHSLLNFDLYKYGLSESNLCSCSGVEDVNHYFFDCPKYSEYRTDLLKSVAKLLSPGVHYSLLLHEDKKHILEIMLHGCTHLSVVENQSLFHNIQTYIKRTRRFEKLLRI